jgi:GNAT superfamily N-acetyltransferase
MIKLVELLKELELDELILRSGELEVDDNKTYYTFLEDFRIPEDEFFDEDQINNNEFNPNLLKKRVISEDGPYQFIVPSTYTGTLYLVNSEGRTIPDYVIGTVDVDVINLSDKRGKPFKITGAEIHLTYVAEPWRGQGLGYKMYIMLLEAYGNVFSDNVLYEGSLGIWANKLAPLGNKSGNFFGAQVGGIVVPMSGEDVGNSNLLKDVGLDHFIISINPPQILLDIKQKLARLSLSNGNYGVFEPSMKTKVSRFQNIVDESASMDEVLEEADLYQVLGVLEDNQYSTIVVALQDAMVILRETDDDIVMDII